MCRQSNLICRTIELYRTLIENKEKAHKAEIERSEKRQARTKENLRIAEVDAKDKETEKITES